jgi:hypothetical protein
VQGESNKPEKAEPWKGSDAYGCIFGNQLRIFELRITDFKMWEFENWGIWECADVLM